MTSDDFDAFSWHDCHIWGLELRVGSAEENDWSCDLALDIDYITEWICHVGGGGRFRVAPATLTFHNVSDLRMAIDWGDSGGRTALHLVSIDRIERTPFQTPDVPLHTANFRWTIHTNWPTGGQLSFYANAFTQRLRAAPVLTDSQSLTMSTRQAFRQAR